MTLLILCVYQVFLAIFFSNASTYITMVLEEGLHMSNVKIHEPI